LPRVVDTDDVAPPTSFDAGLEPQPIAAAPAHAVAARIQAPRLPRRRISSPFRWALGRRISSTCHRQ
jgi:hypothetical protein